LTRSAHLADSPGARSCARRSASSPCLRKSSGSTSGGWLWGAIRPSRGGWMRPDSAVARRWGLRAAGGARRVTVPASTLRRTTGKMPASRPQHRGAGSRRAEQYTNARSICRERRKSYSNLLIRRDLRSHLLPAHMLLTCWNAAQRCATGRGVERCCEARIRPVGAGQAREPGRRLAVKSRLTVNAGASVPHYQLGNERGQRSDQHRRRSAATCPTRECPPDT